MLVNIGKDIALEIDVEKLNASVMQHVVYIGLRNILMDSHASDTEDKHGDEFRAKARETAVAKLQDMYAGNVRSFGSGRTSDPIQARVNLLATQQARKVLKGKYGKLTDVKNDEIVKVRDAIIAKNKDSLVKTATAQIASEKALELDTSDVI